MQLVYIPPTPAAVVEDVAGTAPPAAPAAAAAAPATFV